MTPKSNNFESLGNLTKHVATNVADLGSQTVATTAELVEKIHQTVEDRLAPKRKTFDRKYPTTFIFLAILGISLTFYGLELIINRTPILFNHPYILLAIGIILLIITGRLLKQSYVD